MYLYDKLCEMKLEIIINKIEDSFEAKSPNFPTCIGCGKNKTEAFNNIKDQIKKKLSESLDKQVNELLNKQNATQVVTDPLNKDISHEIFDISDKKSKKLIYKLPLQSDLNIPSNTKRIPHGIFAHGNSIQAEQITDQEDHLINKFSDLFKEHSEQFYYPISLN